MLTGLTYIPTGGTFAGIRIACMESYGIPMLFSCRQDALLYAMDRFGTDDTYRYEPCTEWDAVQGVARVVEVYSGRMKVVPMRNTKGVSSGNLILADPNRKSYEELKQNFHREFYGPRPNTAQKPVEITFIRKKRGSHESP